MLQAMLYVLMLTIRRKSDVDSVGRHFEESLPVTGILLYLGNEETKQEVVSLQWTEVRALVLSRNKLAVDLKRMNEVIFDVVLF